MSTASWGRQQTKTTKTNENNWWIYVTNNKRLRNATPEQKTTNTLNNKLNMIKQPEFRKNMQKNLLLVAT